ncbi:hypothetical protein CALCODRAFT_232798 [Calocera cornea HHB12733]|uniref:Uncharacterized protein n=1 Tax=Calocera cornea HHB12733 TaxID=1353952 RepID=A0A165C057_9BASI|nr:hypothetical protein CALCODRAFT_232798 [Calocera cornea HHB12733]
MRVKRAKRAHRVCPSTIDEQMVTYWKTAVSKASDPCPDAWEKLCRKPERVIEVARNLSAIVHWLIIKDNQDLLTMMPKPFLVLLWPITHKELTRYTCDRVLKGDALASQMAGLSVSEEMAALQSPLDEDPLLRERIARAELENAQLRERVANLQQANANLVREQNERDAFIAPQESESKSIEYMLIMRERDSLVAQVKQLESDIVERRRRESNLDQRVVELVSDVGALEMKFQVLQEDCTALKQELKLSQEETKRLTNELSRQKHQHEAELQRQAEEIGNDWQRTILDIRKDYAVDDVDNMEEEEDKEEQEDEDEDEDDDDDEEERESDPEEDRRPPKRQKVAGPSLPRTTTSTQRQHSGPSSTPEAEVLYLRRFKRKMPPPHVIQDMQKLGAMGIRPASLSRNLHSIFDTNEVYMDQAIEATKAVLDELNSFNLWLLNFKAERQYLAEQKGRDWQEPSLAVQNALTTASAFEWQNNKRWFANRSPGEMCPCQTMLLC